LITHQLYGLVIGCGTTALLTLILIVIDPNDIDFTRAFSWPLLMDSTSLVYWYYCVGLQVAKAILHRRRLKERARGSLASIETPDMIAMCNADEQLRKEFHEFAASRYVVESVNFLQDVVSSSTLVKKHCRGDFPRFVSLSIRTSSSRSARR